MHIESLYAVLVLGSPVPPFPAPIRPVPPGGGGELSCCCRQLSSPPPSGAPTVGLRLQVKQGLGPSPVDRSLGPSPVDWSLGPSPLDWSPLDSELKEVLVNLHDVIWFSPESDPVEEQL